ncbi:hypothetical protein DFA_12282 [Cavenderia fasciculata]|uniref:Uncharacterized protein n=1 Tax=Cavenderia fasciculata TaxID=261658 RepID=F4QCY2_CACFS|nr:uncharacterized protein DFA_12282 [Cavenderia fasciculata]EGG14506.1 hypothetical protein DFA_12282 [Cavenderia fasciculata]|eukprot:XP_004353915.1 hypothetical protein DFA_12282 [Cavenderia fasciculata]
MNKTNDSTVSIYTAKWKCGCRESSFLLDGNQTTDLEQHSPSKKERVSPLLDAIHQTQEDSDESSIRRDCAFPKITNIRVDEANE